MNTRKLYVYLFLTAWLIASFVDDNWNAAFAWSIALALYVAFNGQQVIVETWQRVAESYKLKAGDYDETLRSLATLRDDTLDVVISLRSAGAVDLANAVENRLAGELERARLLTDGKVKVVHVEIGK